MINRLKLLLDVFLFRMLALKCFWSLAFSKDKACLDHACNLNHARALHTKARHFAGCDSLAACHAVRTCKNGHETGGIEHTSSLWTNHGKFAPSNYGAQLYSIELRHDVVSARLVYGEGAELSSHGLKLRFATRAVCVLCRLLTQKTSNLGLANAGQVKQESRDAGQYAQREICKRSRRNSCA